MEIDERRKPVKYSAFRQLILDRIGQLAILLMLTAQVKER